MDSEDHEGSLGAVFAQIIGDLRNTSPLWEELISRAQKLQTCLRITIQALNQFLEAFQRIADAATNSKGGSKQIGTALTRVCLRHKAVESRLKNFTIAIMDCLITPLSEKLETWKKQVAHLDKEHSKNYKKCRSELKKVWTSSLRRQKKIINKGTAAENAKALLDGSIQDVSQRETELERIEREAVKAVMIEERQMYCSFVYMLQPVVKEECEVISELSHLQEAMQTIGLVTKNPTQLPSDDRAGSEPRITPAGSPTSSQRSTSRNSSFKRAQQQAVAWPTSPPAQDIRPHTISTGYEKIHQRSPLTMRTFEDPGLNSPQKNSRESLNRPPLPIRRSSLQKSGASTPTSRNQSPIRPEPPRQLYETKEPESTYVNLTDLAILNSSSANSGYNAYMTAAAELSALSMGQTSNTTENSAAVAAAATTTTTTAVNQPKSENATPVPTPTVKSPIYEYTLSTSAPTPNHQHHLANNIKYSSPILSRATFNEQKNEEPAYGVTLRRPPGSPGYVRRSNEPPPPPPVRRGSSVTTMKSQIPVATQSQDNDQVTPSGNVADTVRALNRMQHTPASPNVLRKSQSSPKQSRDEHLSIYESQPERISSFVKTQRIYALPKPQLTTSTFRADTAMRYEQQRAAQQQHQQPPPSIAVPEERNHYKQATMTTTASVMEENRISSGSLSFVGRDNTTFYQRQTMEQPEPSIVSARDSTETRNRNTAAGSIVAKTGSAFLENLNQKLSEQRKSYESQGKVMSDVARGGGIGQESLMDQIKRGVPLRKNSSGSTLASFPRVDQV